MLDLRANKETGIAPAGSVRRLTVTLFGQFSCRIGDQELRFSKRKLRCLIGYLALAERHEATRDRLVGLLWGESDQNRARGSLRTTLHEIRGLFHGMGYGGLITDKQSVALDQSSLDVDLWDVLAAAKAGQPHPLLLEAPGLFDTLMQDLVSVDAEFDVWLAARRQALQQRLTQDLEKAMRAHQALPGNREALARALMNLDPTHEEAARELIRARVADGDIGAAMSIYRALWELLESEFEVEPTSETQQLIASIRQSQPMATPPLPAAPMMQTLVAVAPQMLVPQMLVPQMLAPQMSAPRSRPAGVKLLLSLGLFDAAAVASEQRYLVDQFRRELIACLVRFREWIVQDRPGPPANVARHGDDEFVLDGGASQADGGLRLVLNLRDAKSNAYLWSERLDITLESWWASQQKIVRRMASALNVHISTGRMAHLAQRPESDLIAYDHWLRGQATMHSFEASDWHRASEIFRAVVAMAPDFAPGHSSLAQLHNAIHVYHHGVFREPQRRVEALACAREAVHLDPVDSRGQLALAWAYLMAEQHDQATAHYELAADLNDNDPWTLVSAALGLAFSGVHDRARALADQALILSLPPSGTHWGYQARIRFLGGDLIGAEEAAQRAADAPAWPGWRTAILMQGGHGEAAAQEWQRFLDVSRARWCGREAWSPQLLARWFLHAFPIRKPQDWERLRDQLASAGAIVEGLEVGFWRDEPAQMHMPTA